MSDSLLGEDASPLFEERAENLSAEDFQAWTYVSRHEEAILRHLSSTAPKLLVGPRGCGKSTLLRLARDRIRSAGKSLPLLVNYGRSMSLEPAFTMRPDAAGFFQDWLVARILVSLSDELPGIRSSPKYLDLVARCRDFMESAEVDSTIPRPKVPGPTALSSLLEDVAEETGHTSVILLLDDAAHAFVPEQQRIFFEFLRSMKSSRVTYKAAIYPGVTGFSPNFNVGHDAKSVPAWVDTSGGEYLKHMRQLLDKRLPDRGGVTMSDDLVDLFAVAAFGVPRAFISMIERYINANPAPGRVQSVANRVIREGIEETQAIFDQLEVKLHSYANYIRAGRDVQSRMLALVSDFNRKRIERSVETQAVEVAIRQPIDPKLSTIFDLMEYAGLLRQTKEAISVGSDGTYTKISLNSGLLMATSSLSYGRRNPSVGERVQVALRKTTQATYVRTQSNQLLSMQGSDDCVLLLGACTRCNTPRESPNARFCSFCGSPLTEESRYRALTRSDLDVLNLTSKKYEALSAVGFRVVEDVLRDRGMSKMQTADRIGPVWANRILSRAEEYTGV